MGNTYAAGGAYSSDFSTTDVGVISSMDADFRRATLPGLDPYSPTKGYVQPDTPAAIPAQIGGAPVTQNKMFMIDTEACGILECIAWRR